MKTQILSVLYEGVAENDFAYLIATDVTVARDHTVCLSICHIYMPGYSS